MKLRLLLFSLLTSQIVWAQTATQNHVITLTPRVEISNEANVTFEATPLNARGEVNYLDGLGRTQQMVVKGISPQGQDQVQLVVYDSLGRMSVEYLPYVGTLGDGSYRTDALANQNSFYNTPPLGVTGDSEPYAQTVFEPSPLNRPIQQGAPGAAFQPATGHAVEYEYLVNDVAQHPARQWTIDENGIPSSNGLYTAGTLTVMVTTDEDEKTSEVYTNKLGQVVLRRVLDGVDSLDTYYLYDKYNNLRVVLPPKVAAIPNPSEPDLEQLAFRYEYDERQRMSQKKVPGAGWQYMIYDQRDRLILSQDGRQRQQGEWLFTHYDTLNRSVVEGIYPSENTYGEMLTEVATYLATDSINVAVPVGEDEVQSHLHGDPSLELDSYGRQRTITATTSITLEDGFEISFNEHGPVDIYLDDVGPTPPANGAFPVLANSEILKLYHYDNYDFDQDGSAEYAYDATGIASGADITWYSNVQGQLAGTTVRILDTDEWLTTAMFYDYKGRMIQTQAENHIGGWDKMTTEYSFHGLMLRQWHQQTSSNAWGSRDLTVLTRHEYDQADRLTYVYQTVGNEDEHLLAYHEYNALGQLIDKGVHKVGDDSVTYCQSVDYRYTIRGWLASINEDDLVENPAGSSIIAADDLFGQQFAYNDLVAGWSGQQPQFNGNISAITWNSTALNQPHGYRYSYDSINRLTAAASQIKDVNTNAWSGRDHYSVSGITYDNNGNIETLQRYGADASLMDDLAYSYQGNRLTGVEESTSGDATLGFVDGTVDPVQYEYDSSGNLTVDRNKDITAIAYNHLNLPDTLTFANGNQIHYTYDAMGTKLMQEVIAADTSRTDYVAGRQYKDRALDFLTHAEGRTKFTANGFTQHYDLKDHLGNVRLTFAGEETLTTFAATMESGGTLAKREEAYFENIDDSRRTLAYHNASPPSTEEPVPNKVATLNAAKGVVKGPAKSLRVHPGDSIHIEVKASYEEHSRKKVKGGSGILATVSALFSPAAVGVEVVGASEGLNEALAGATLLDRDKTGVPKAYLNYMVMNDDKQVIDQGFVPVSEAARIETGRRGYGKRRTEKGKNVATVDSVAHETLAVDLDIAQEGYLYTYVSNESNWDVDVHFDQMAVAASSSAPLVVQSQDYYPFGLTFEQPLSNNLPNRYLYQGQELGNDLGLNVYQFQLRSYDPSIGRWWQTDPYDQFDSPYVGMGNNPISGIDPDGGYTRFGAWVRALFTSGVSTSDIYQSGGEWGFNTQQGSTTTFNVGNYGEDGIGNSPNVAEAQQTNIGNFPSSLASGATEPFYAGNTFSAAVETGANLAEGDLGGAGVAMLGALPLVGKIGKVAYRGIGRIQSLQGKSVKWLQRNKPRGWRQVPTRNNEGWIWVDENGVERMRFMRPSGRSATNSQWARQENGYMRWQNEGGEFLDIDGNVVQRTDPMFQQKTHIPYEGI